MFLLEMATANAIYCLCNNNKSKQKERERERDKIDETGFMYIEYKTHIIERERGRKSEEK